MFGRFEALRDVLPGFHVDYRERLSGDLKMPFQLDRELYRKGDSAVHEALREAVVNVLMHADHSGQGGVVIER